MYTILLPVLFESSVVVFPGFSVFFFPSSKALAVLIISSSDIPHDNYLLALLQISARDCSMIQMNVPKISSVFQGFILIEAHQVIAEVVPLEEDWGVEIEVKIKQ